MSKRGQGLGLIAVLVLIAILYFVFRYNTDTYGFVMNAGDEQAHLATAYTEGVKAKSFVQLSARQAAFEAIWQLSSKSTAGNALVYCNNAGFPSKFQSFFDIYLAMYVPTTDLIDTSLPDYKFTFTCPASSPAGSLIIEGAGYSEKCTLINTFPFPQYPCEDQLNKTSCESIKFTQSTNFNNGKACTWTADLKCAGSLPEPNCESMQSLSTCGPVTSPDGMRYCWWQVSYAEPIDIVSAPLINYQFSIDSDAHFIENISGPEYTKFTKARAAAFPPGCIIKLKPETPIGNANFDITTTYTDDDVPKAIVLKVTHGSTVDVKADLTGLSETDSNDKIYSNGKDYYKTAALTEGTYSADVTCTDSDGNSVTATKGFTVTK